MDLELVRIHLAIYYFFQTGKDFFLLDRQKSQSHIFEMIFIQQMNNFKQEKRERKPEKGIKGNQGIYLNHTKT